LKEVAKHVEVPVILVLDEINRCNLADVLGELILTLEEDKRSSSDDEGWPVRLQYPPPGDGDGNFAMPDNLYVLGTMNTADQSIANIDYAIRRRFRFIDAPPDRGVIKKEYDDDIKQGIALSIFTEINGNGDGDDNPIVEEDRLKIGHSHFLIDDSEDGQSDNGDHENKAEENQSDEVEDEDGVDSEGDETDEKDGNSSQDQSENTNDKYKNWAETLANRLVYDVGPLLREYERAGELEDNDDGATINLGEETFDLLDRNESQSQLKKDMKCAVISEMDNDESDNEGEDNSED
jgi:hypothetical protein